MQRPPRGLSEYDQFLALMLVLLTNQFDLPANVIAELYRKRWQVELFFKWIKQHRRVRSFYGRSDNAVRSQVWSAICASLMVAILRKQLKIQKTLNEILQIVSPNRQEADREFRSRLCLRRIAEKTGWTRSVPWKRSCSEPPTLPPTRKFTTSSSVRPACGWR
jgi:transposase